MSAYEMIIRELYKNCKDKELKAQLLKQIKNFRRK